MFIPEPDLPLNKITKRHIDEISKTLPERPQEKLKKFMKLGINPVDAKVISSEIILASIFEEAIKAVNPTLAARWIRRDLLSAINFSRKDIEDLRIDTKQVITLLKLVEEKRITDTVGKELLTQLVDEPFDVKERVEEQALNRVSDEDELEMFSKKAIEESEGAVKDYKEGEEKALNNIVGKVMKYTKGKADPNIVKKIIKELINDEP